MWLGVQLLALLLPLSRIPLAAHYPQPAEMTIAWVMAAVQVTAAVLLAPFLLRDWHSTLAAVATTWPFLILAAVVSGVPISRAAWAGVYVSSWLAALWLLNALPSPRLSRHVLLAGATLLTAGTLVLFYLRLEFAADAAGDPIPLATTFAPASPPFAAMRLLDKPPNGRIWCMVLTAGALGLVCRIIAHRSRHVIHKFPTS